MRPNAIIIRPDGTYELANININDLRTLQGLVEGYIAAVYGFWNQRGEPTAAFFHNEEAKLLDMPLNRAATEFWYMADDRVIGIDQLHGVVVVTGFADPDGNTLPVPEEVIEAWLSMQPESLRQG